MLLTSPNLAALTGICTDPQRKERLKSNHGKCWLLERGVVGKKTGGTGSLLFFFSFRKSVAAPREAKECHKSSYNPKHSLKE